MNGSSDQSTLRFGVARRCITPRVPVSLCGYFYLRMWQRVRDDLHVSVLALKQGAASSAIVQFDWAVMPYPVVQRLRTAIADVKGLDPMHVICTATHTHTSPETRHDQPGYSDEYASWAVDQAAAAVREAMAGLGSCDGLRIGAGRVEGVAFNRRYWMRSTGRVATNPPRGSDDIAGPEGTTDPEIPLVMIERAGRPAVMLASIVNHTDTLGTSEISSDWPGVVRQELEAKYGPGLLVMPLIGASGNVNHVDATRIGEIYSQDNPQRIGRAYVDDIERQIDRLRRVDWHPFSVCRREFIVAPRQIDPAELEQAKIDSRRYADAKADNMTSEDLAAGNPAAIKYFADALLRVAADRRDRTYEVIAIRLGQVVFVSMPGEPFVEVGLNIRNVILRGYHAMPISHGNAAANYFPMPENYEHGGYETTPLCSSHGTDSALRMLGAVREAIAGVVQEHSDVRVSGSI